KVMELISEYLGGDIPVGTSMMYYGTTHNMLPWEIASEGVDSSHLNDLVSHYFDMTATADIQNSIDSGYPVMAYIEVSAGIGHEVMISGYNKKDDAQYTNQNYDPEAATYATKEATDFNSIIIIT